MGALLCITNSRLTGAGLLQLELPFGSMRPRFNCQQQQNKKILIIESNNTSNSKIASDSANIYHLYLLP